MKPDPKHIIEQNKIKDRSDLHITLGFDTKNKIWKFVGWLCGRCNQSLKTEYVAKKHTCQPYLLRRYNSDPNEGIDIRTTDGKPWASIKKNLSEPD